MQQQFSPTTIRKPIATCTAFTCPVQVLVIDAVDGPANVLINTISLLLDREISVTTVDDHTDALCALNYYDFDLVVVGLHPNRPLQLTILPHIFGMDARRPILAVGHDLPRLYQQYARTYGAREVLNIPQRAADLKRLVGRVAAHYLNSA